MQIAAESGLLHDFLGDRVLAAESRQEEIDRRREPSDQAIRAVMRTFLSRCEADTEVAAEPPPSTPSATAQTLSQMIAEAQCEEAAAGL